MRTHTHTHTRSKLLSPYIKSCLVMVGITFLVYVYKVYKCDIFYDFIDIAPFGLDMVYLIFVFPGDSSDRSPGLELREVDVTSFLWTERCA